MNGRRETARGGEVQWSGACVMRCLVGWRCGQCVKEYGKGFGNDLATPGIDCLGHCLYLVYKIVLTLNALFI